MNQLPYNFNHRVAALSNCISNEFPWIPKATKTRIQFYIGSDYGRWKYGFSSPDNDDNECLTMDQLMKHPNLKHLIVGFIAICENPSDPLVFALAHSDMKPLDVDVERLMKFVAFMSNEPQLELECRTVEQFSSAEGSTLLQSLSKMHFSRIEILNSFPVYNRVIENQFSRRRPTPFSVSNLDGNEDFYGRHLGNGNIKLFLNLESGNLPIESVEGIVNNFLKNPQNYKEDQLEITTYFDEKTTRALLDKKFKSGQCEKKDNGWLFHAFNPMLNEDVTLRIRNSYSLWDLWYVDLLRSELAE